MRQHRPFVAALLFLSLLGCKWAPAPSTVPRPVAAKPRPAVAPKAGLTPVKGGGAIPLTAEQTVGTAGGTLVALKAGVRISEDGQRLINLDGGSLINLDGGALQGGSLGAMMGTVRVPAGVLAGGAYRLAEAAAVPAPGVRVYFRDAAGRFLIDPEGNPVSATTDAQGRFLLQGYLAARGLTCFVPLEEAGGSLRGFSAVRPRDHRSGVPVVVDPVSTVLTGWVEGEVLRQLGEAARETSLDRLTGAVTSQARQHLERALGAGWAGTSLDWSTAAVAAEAERQRARDGALDGALREVRRALVAGLDPCEDGTRALETSMRLPLALAAPVGSRHLVVSGYLSGLVQRIEGIGEEPRLFAVAGNCPGLRSLPVPLRFAAGPDGWVYSVSDVEAAVHRFRADGSAVELVAGTGNLAPAEGLVATDLELDIPAAVAKTAAGELWIGERGTARLIRIGSDGKVRRVYTDFAPQASNAVGLTTTPDGTLWVLTERDGDGVLFRFDPGTDGFARTAEIKGEVGFSTSNVQGLPDGRLAVSCGYTRSLGHRIQLVDPATGKVSVLAGGLTPGFNEPGLTVTAEEALFSLPAGLAVLPDERGPGWTLYVADLHNGLIRAVDPQGRVRIAAGSRAAQSELARGASLAQPVAVTLDAQGRPVLTEGGGHAVRRLEGERLVRLAGGQPGSRPSKALLPADRLNMPTGIAGVGTDFFLAESGSRSIARLYANGRIEVVAGGGIESEPLRRVEALQARDLNFQTVFAVTADAQGRAIFSGEIVDRRPEFNEDGPFYLIWRLEPDGTITRLAGGLEGPDDVTRDGKQGKQVRLGYMMGLATDAGGNLFFSEAVNGMVWRLDPQGVLHRMAGLGLVGTVARLGGASPRDPRETPAAEALLLAPAGIAVGPDGSVYVAEFGTVGLASYAAELGIDFGFNVSTLPQLGGRIRQLTPDGRAIILAGEGLDDAVRSPCDVELGASGALLVVDNGAGQLKELPLRPR